MEFRKTEKKEIDSVLKIITDAKNFFKLSGIDQWQGEYPNYDTIEQDIIKGNSYVLVDNYNNVLSTISCSLDGEPSYEQIYNGEWLSKEQFAALQRVAVSTEAKGKGLAKKMIDELELICKQSSISSMRIITHHNNVPMQKSIYKSGFQHCGSIYLDCGSERMSFEKIVSA